MKALNVTLVCLLAVSMVSCSQPVTQSHCKEGVDSLYKKYGKHLLFYTFYVDSTNKYVNADSVFDNYLPWYRESAGIENLQKSDSIVLQRLSEMACLRDSSFLTRLKSWCDVSLFFVQVRDDENFTLDGYMDFLLSDTSMKSVIENYLGEGRSVSSLSTDEIERVFFASIGSISSTPAKLKELFFVNLRKHMLKTER